MDMLAQNLAQSLLQQVGSRVVAADSGAALLVHRGSEFILNMDGAVQQLAGMDKVALRGLFDLRDLQLGITADKVAVVCDLTAHLGIERGLVQYDKHALLDLAGFIGGNGVHKLLAIGQCQHLGLLAQRLIAVKAGRLCRQLAEQVGAPTGNILCQTLGAGALTLLGHLNMEGCLIDCKAGLRSNLTGQIEGEAEGVIQLEGLNAGQNLLMRLLQAAHHAVQNAQTGINGTAETLLLGTDDLLDIGLMLAQLGVACLAGFDNRVYQLGQERAVDAQHTAMARSAAQQTAHNIAAALVGGQDAIRCHKDRGADVVGDNADGNVILLVLAVLLACNALHMVQNSGNGIDLKQVVDILHDNGQTLQTHAGINVGSGQQLIVALAVSIVLAEHKVPDLHEAVAVTADTAGGLAAAVLQAAVKVNLRARAAGAGAMLPEVILLAQTDHVILGDADLLRPDVVSLVILLIHGNIQAVSGDLQLLGQELPCPGNNFLLEVVLEAEVAQHLKEAAMAGRDADTLNIRGADALLAGSHAMARRLLLTKEPLFHGGHAAVDQQQAGVILRHQREAAQAQMILRLKIVQVLLTQFVQSGPLHRYCSPIHKIAIAPPQKNTAHAPLQGRRLLCFRGTTQFAIRTAHRRFVSALTPQVRSALRRKLRGGSAVLTLKTLHRAVFSLRSGEAALALSSLFFLLQAYYMPFCPSCQRFSV